MRQPITVRTSRVVLTAYRETPRDTDATETPAAFDRDPAAFEALAPGCYQRRALPAAE